MLTVEIEVNKDSKSYKLTNDNLALAALVREVQKYFLTVHYFNLCVPIALQPGQAVVQGRLSLNVFLRSMLCSSLCYENMETGRNGARHRQL
jgi:hypothetical protein